MAACDTFRSGAVEQLRTHARRLQVYLWCRVPFSLLYWVSLLDWDVIRIGRAMWGVGAFHLLKIALLLLNLQRFLKVGPSFWMSLIVICPFHCILPTLYNILLCPLLFERIPEIVQHELGLGSWLCNYLPLLDPYFWEGLRKRSCNCSKGSYSRGHSKWFRCCSCWYCRSNAGIMFDTSSIVIVLVFCIKAWYAVCFKCYFRNRTFRTWVTAYN